MLMFLCPVKIAKQLDINLSSTLCYFYMSKRHFNVLLPLDVNTIVKSLSNTVILRLLHLYKNMEIVTTVHICNQLLNIYVAQSPKNIYCNK